MGAQGLRYPAMLPSSPETKTAAPAPALSIYSQVVQESEATVLRSLRGGLLDPSWAHVEHGQNLMFFAAARSRKLGGAQAIAVRLHELGVHASDEDDLMQTPLYYAAREGNLECAKFLIESKCDVNHSDFNLQSPLFYAAREGRVDMCRLLREHGADFGIVDKRGRSASSFMSLSTRTALSKDRSAGRATSASGTVASARITGRKAASLLPGNPSAGGRKAITVRAGVSAVANSAEGASGAKRRKVLVNSPGPDATSAVAVSSVSAAVGVAPGDTEPVGLEDIRHFVANGGGCGADSEDVAPYREASSPPAASIPEDSLADVDCGEHGRFYVAQPREGDVMRLRAVEREFVLDHAGLFDGDHRMVGRSLRDWCGAVNVIVDEAEACGAIARIVLGKTRGHVTLQCVHVPASKDEQPQVVGYVHFVTLGKHVEASHLKVANSHARRGLGALLLAGMARYVERSRGSGLGCADIRLVVMSKNVPAISLYKGLSFEAEGNLEKPVGKGAPRIGWTRMRRLSKDSPGEDLVSFVQHCVARVHARCGAARKGSGGERRIVDLTDSNVDLTDSN